jgi:hypothetical protein
MSMLLILAAISFRFIGFSMPIRDPKALHKICKTGRLTFELFS